MKQRKSSREQMLASCAEIAADDNVDPRTFFQKKSQNKNNRKALQLCEQVATTLRHALAWETGDNLLRFLQVESVVPAPDSGHLLVAVSLLPSADDSVPIDRVGERLQRATGMLRAFVAAAIHRRRVPNLSFHLALPLEVKR